MPHTIFVDLRRIVVDLAPHATVCYGSAERKALRAALASTIPLLHLLYPSLLSAGQRHQLLQNLSMLEQQLSSLSELRSDEHGCPKWRSINSALRAAIMTTLDDDLASS
ncbi:hypothetical protein [Hymenobacter yonginensis]|uniref:Uncharacterized protein n=1 Tax=Hymenobacter yonginensis TaxID=748197 RepID=A0ABY7PSW1_9BACT|nr:hypothetical protein [Hymenobacter yonginensis]WBO85976.1 hypothetical protein O9Z63_06915 [Hymenobacter yonginensis]